MIFFIFSVIKVLFFYDPECPDCKAVEDSILPIINKIPYVRLKMLSVKKMENMELLMKIEDEHKDYNNGIPVAVVEDSIFGNRKEIEEGLIPFLMTLKPDGREKTYKTPVNSIKLKSPVYVLYFYSSGCHKCSKVDIYLKSLEREYPLLHIERKNVVKDPGLLLSIEKSMGVEKNRLLVTPVVLIDSLIFFEKDIKNLKKTIEKISLSGGNSLFWKDYRESGVYSLLSSLKSTGIFLAGAIDGINPCAFAVLIFLVALLSIQGGKREIFLVGIPFIISVYFTYLLIGMGIFSIFRQLEGVKLAGRILYIMSGLLAIVLGVLSFRDALLFKSGKNMTLQMPERFKRLVRWSIRKGFKRGMFLLAGLSIGFIVTLFEFTCTGQVYYPIISYIAKQPEMKIRALRMLIVYNTGFILPIILVFILALLGFGQREFNRFLIKRVPAVKVLTGFLLTGIGAWVIYLSL